MRGRHLPAVLVAFALLLPVLAQAADKPLATDGRTIWSYLKSGDYKKSLILWPDTAEFAKGRSLHGSLTTVYVNRAALDGINGHLSELPVGALIVKENYDDAKAMQNIVVKLKARSYNPSGGNWYWAKFGPDGEIQMEGRVKPCIGCHTDRKDNDYIATSNLK